MHGQLVEWTQDIADVLARPPGRAQLQALADWLQRFAFADHIALFIHEGRDPPLALFDTIPPNLRQLFVGDYQAGPYLLDPFYLACVFGQADGLYSMRRLAPERFYNTSYYCSYYRYLGLSEQLGFIISLGEQGGAVLSLMRLRGGAAFSDGEMQLLRSAAPVVEQVVRAAWEVYRQPLPQARSGVDDKVDEAFEQFGRGVLTVRECEVARLLLEGHSNRSASQQLRIAPGTVKVHRRNLYEKLEVGSQSELLALFVRELKSG
ncbi:helix-turn-helix transcriptional regulator [Pseudomonas resinovorans]|uniref:helix-turn-helix transcriptional regulator n=1 Tax=Metapseudomonas resinovorans TaxID=53412 RepID=UPI00237F6FE4|nr:helix-turn-helix transcriptional regulator [Pseudomonas resinovorans]MDE3735039.1 helix-turn-helix transcriptional regulator [Pseudomonas resinovorans]